MSASSDRRGAVEAMYDYYDAHRGRRRTPARDAFEVFRTRRTDAGLVLYVRRRSRKRGAGGDRLRHLYHADTDPPDPVRDHCCGCPCQVAESLRSELTHEIELGGPIGYGSCPFGAGVVEREADR